QIHDAGADRAHLLLETATFLGATPIVALEKDVEPDAAPSDRLVARKILHDRVDPRQSGDDDHSLVQRHRWELATRRRREVVADHADGQTVATLTSAFEDAEVPDVEQVVRARDVADDGHGALTSSASVAAVRSRFCS